MCLANELFFSVKRFAVMSAEGNKHNMFLFCVI